MTGFLRFCWKATPKKEATRTFPEETGSFFFPTEVLNLNMEFWRII
jgi:hypothetical protein